VPRQLATLTRLGALGHLDLKFISIDKVFVGNAKPAGRHLLDGAAAQVPVHVGFKAMGILTALARVTAPADAVHGNGQRFVSLAADAAEGHGAGAEALHDFRCRFHFIEAHRRPLLKFQQAAQGRESAVAIIDRLGELFVRFGTVLPGGMLQRGDSVGVPLVKLAPAPPAILTTRVQVGLV